MDKRFFLALIAFGFVALLFIDVEPQDQLSNRPQEQREPLGGRIEPPQVPDIPEITTVIPSYLNYAEVYNQLKEWEAEAPGLVEVGIYGNSTKGKELYYIRVTNLLDDTPKPKALITSCIHGNEPLSASTTIAQIGTMLSKYGTDDRITTIINTRDIYFIPVVSPDSYPHSRHVDGVDPNRNFPTDNNPNKNSVKPVRELRKFFLQHKFNAVISGHTWGRQYLTPWGKTTRDSPHQAKFKDIVGRMAELSNYELMKASQLYGRPIYGIEADWYYRNGAFAIITEFGTHQRKPSLRDTQYEFKRTFQAFLLFLEEAPVAITRELGSSVYHKALPGRQLLSLASCSKVAA